MLTQERLKELVTYSKETGLFHWRVGRVGCKKGSACGYLNPSGYIEVKIDGSTYGAHRLAFLYVLGKWPTGLAGHTKGDKSDNRWASLSDLSVLENSQDAKLSKANTSGVLGVSKHLPSYSNGDTKWRVQIRVDGKKKHLGIFRDFDKACKVRADADIKYGFHKDHGKR